MKMINLIKKVLNSANKRKLYNTEELRYMQTQLKQLVAHIKQRKLESKINKGFGPNKPVTSQNNTENFDD